jgi:hypothetical protein
MAEMVSKSKVSEIGTLLRCVIDHEPHNFDLEQCSMLANVALIMYTAKVYKS